MSDEWLPVATMPQGVWCRTKLEGEMGENECFWRPDEAPEFWDGEGREYIDRRGYTTVINPGTFCAPSHWKPL